MLSGAPSTTFALVRGTDPLEATRAAGRLLVPAARSDAVVLPAAALAHALLTTGWTVVLRRLPGGLLRGAGYGLAIAALDLGLARAVRGRRFGPIAELDLLPQLADHLAFGVLVAGFSARARARPSAPRAGR